MVGNHNVTTFILKRPRIISFPDVIKIATMFIKTTFKDPSKI